MVLVSLAGVTENVGPSLYHLSGLFPILKRNHDGQVGLSLPVAWFGQVSRCGRQFTVVLFLDFHAHIVHAYVIIQVKL